MSKDLKTVRSSLESKLSQPANKLDAALYLMLLNNVESVDKGFNLMKEVFPLMDNKSAILYPMWLDQSVTGGYFTRSESRFEFYKKMLYGNEVNASIKASTNYAAGFFVMLKNDMKGSATFWKNMGALREWSFVGPFSNLSGSGYDKDYAPIKSPEHSTVFKSWLNSDIKWFTPVQRDIQPWILLDNYIRYTSGIIYAQTFVKLEADREVTIAAGSSGNIKVWANDQLVLSEEEDRRTEVDMYERKIKLKKGTNRILVQLGYTGKTTNANFIIRFIDKDGTVFKNYKEVPYTADYVKGTAADVGEEIEHYVKQYFEDKIALDSNNTLAQIMLSKFYYRNSMWNEAIEVLKPLSSKHPDNILVKYELLLNYSKIGNSTETLKELDKVRKLGPDLAFLAVYDYTLNMQSDNYEEAEKNVEIIRKAQGSTDVDYYVYKIDLLSEKNDIQELLDVAEEAFVQHPTYVDFVKYKYRIEKAKNRKAKYGVKMLEKYLANRYSSTLTNLLLEEYKSAGDRAKEEKLRLKLYKEWPANSTYSANLASYYFLARNYQKSLDLILTALKTMPYNSSTWLNASYVYEALEQDDKAMEALHKAIEYNPNLFDARDRLRELEGKPSLHSHFRKKDAYDIIALESAEYEEEFNFEYLFQERNYVLFKEGASTQFNSMAIRVHNETGVERWKDINIGYDSGSEVLRIEKAEVVKANGTKIKADESGNQVVFSSLEAGDCIYIEYRIDNYVGEVLTNEFSTQFLFNGFEPQLLTKLRLYAPKGYDFSFAYNNVDSNLVKSEVENFDVYEWNMDTVPVAKEEYYMPTLNDIGMNLIISTVDDWATISHMYRDLAMPKAKEDYILDKVYDGIFKDTIFKNEYAKAEAIYDYICDNITYSSIAFRQSNLVPQKPMQTISSQLGDCKDLATLYHTLAKKAGLKSNLVLVLTRDNGESHVQLPSFNFNHCIIRFEADDATYFQELTDNHLPFGSLPYTVKNAQALIIPGEGDEVTGTDLVHIPEGTKLKSHIYKHSEIKVVGTNLDVEIELKISGAASSDYRSYFMDLTKEKEKEDVGYVFSQYFDNQVELHNHDFQQLDGHAKELNLNANFTVEGEIKKIGKMQMLKIPLFGEILSSEDFHDKERTNKLNYWKYDVYDSYDTETVIAFPAGKKLMELPEGYKLRSKWVDYDLRIERLAGNKIKVTRKVSYKNKSIEPSDYPAFRKAVLDIVSAQDIYIAYQ
ncbi:MAG: DUF3857 domain-containing protein [Flavobacteriales bacterium]|nr:DUF3857 domain-containing protein [Flavobacteriales bacterium]